MAEPIRPNFNGINDATSPLTRAFAITPSDDDDLAVVPRCVISDLAGTLVVDMAGGDEGVSIPIQPGYNPIMVTKVYATGTTAGLVLVGAY
jgi:hypothetical protein